MSANSKRSLVAVAIFAALGVVFCAFSAHDFIIQLDRQVHAINCSYVPGVGGLDETGSSGCYAVMVSPYSSVFRSVTWGGIPIALPGLSVFAYLLALSIYIVAAGAYTKRMGQYLIAAAFLPVITSIWYAYVSVYIVGSVCKLCVGIYASSLGVLVASATAYAAQGGEGADEKPPWGRWAALFAEGVLFVAIPAAAYLLLKPAPTVDQMRCGALVSQEDRYGVMIPVNKGQGGHRIIEVIDPLCPACEAFSKVFKASKQLAGLDVKGVLFPLEKDCNWMIPQTLHPGSCAISEAVLCAGEGKVGAVLEWAMARNEELRSMAQENPQAVVAEIKKTFPELASCVGSPEAKSKVNKSLRWIVGNALPVLTPQLYVDGRRLCTEDTDLGFEYAMKKLLALSPAAQLGSADQKRPVKR